MTHAPLDFSGQIRAGSSREMIIESGLIRVGASSWSDKSLTQDGNWYPRKTMKAVDRIAFYADRLSVVEMENTYRFPPTAAVSEQWSQRTPDHFRIDLQAWSLLTEQPTFPPSLWEDLVTEVPEDRRDKPRLYSSHLSNDALTECWNRFTYALRPLVDAGRLGTVILRYPRWFVPRHANRQTLERAREHLGDIPASVEFACPDWVDSECCEDTFAMLEDLQLGFVCVDAAEGDPRQLRGVSATTSDIAVLRMIGRRPVEDRDAWLPDGRSYRYTQAELRALLPRLEHLAGGARELHVLFGTCWKDDAVRNAETMQEIVAERATRLRSER